MPFQMENGSQAIFLNPFTVCLSRKQKFVICQFAEENKLKFSTGKRTKRTCPSMNKVLFSEFEEKSRLGSFDLCW